MNKSILKTVVVSAVAVMFSVGCSEKPEDEGGNTGGKGNDISNYRTVTIGTQTWMAENLNYDVGRSTCHDNTPTNCTKYGRLYDWHTAMEACPAGWHLPSDAEWTILTDYVGGWSTAGIKLKSTSGWNDYEGKSGNGTDEFGFSALPGGNEPLATDGYNGYWWSADELVGRRMSSEFESVNRITIGGAAQFSVRCVRNN
jgi:uncharacterized protein (TIGR02145 family)